MTYTIDHFSSNHDGALMYKIGILKNRDNAVGRVPGKVLAIMAEVLRENGFEVETPYSDPELKTGDIVTDVEGLQKWVYVPRSPGVDNRDFIPLDLDGFWAGTPDFRDELPDKIKKAER